MSDLNSNMEQWNVLFRDEQNNMVVTQGTIPIDIKKNIRFKGRNNKVFLASDCVVTNLVISMVGNKNLIEIGRHTNLVGKLDMKGSNQTIKIGDYTTFQSVSLFSKEGCDIIIGQDCMFSARIEIRTSDSHTIFDLDTKKRLNKPGSIFIGDHVWIGKDVMVSKGVTIAKNTIIGAKSFVAKSLLDEDCIYVGAPAKKVKERVGWTRELLPWCEN